MVLFFITLTFIWFPSIYLFFNVSVLKSQTLVKLISFGIFLFLIMKNGATSKRSFTTNLILIYLFIRSLSIINTPDVSAFIVGYQRFFFGFAIFFIVLHLSNNPKFYRYFFISLFVLTAISICVELLLFFYPENTLSILKNILYEPDFNLIQDNINRGRIYFSFYNELSIPILVYYLFAYVDKSDLNVKRFIVMAFSLLLNIFVLITGYISLWRIRVVDYFIALSASFALLSQGIKKRIGLFTVFVFFIIISLSVSYISYNQGLSIVDRFLLPESQIDDLIGRSRLWEKTVEVGSSYPILGVGFDNFSVFFSNKTRLTLSKSVINLSNLTMQSPHNIFLTHFVENGLVGLVFFVLLIFYFLCIDIYSVIKRRTIRDSRLLIILIIQFWILIIYGFFHPTDTSKYYFLFFGLRGFIDSFSLFYGKRSE